MEIFIDANLLFRKQRNILPSAGAFDSRHLRLTTTMILQQIALEDDWLLEFDFVCKSSWSRRFQEMLFADFYAEWYFTLYTWNGELGNVGKLFYKWYFDICTTFLVLGQTGHSDYLWLWSVGHNSTMLVFSCPFGWLLLLFKA